MPGGLDAVVAELSDPRLREFVRQKFQSTSRYDVVPLPYLGMAVARVRRVSFEQQLLDSNRYSEARAGALYRALLGLVSAESVALLIPRAAAIVHDFGKVTTRVVGARRVAGVRTGVPRVLVRWLSFSNAAYLELALARGGAAQPLVEFARPVPEGASLGQPHYSLPFEVSWA